MHDLKSCTENTLVHIFPFITVNVNVSFVHTVAFAVQSKSDGQTNHAPLPRSLSGRNMCISCLFYTHTWDGKTLRVHQIFRDHFQSSDSNLFKAFEVQSK